MRWLRVFLAGRPWPARAMYAIWACCATVLVPALLTIAVTGHVALPQAAMTRHPPAGPTAHPLPSFRSTAASYTIPDRSAHAPHPVRIPIDRNVPEGSPVPAAAAPSPVLSPALTPSRTPVAVTATATATATATQTTTATATATATVTTQPSPVPSPSTPSPAPTITSPAPSPSQPDPGGSPS